MVENEHTKEISGRYKVGVSAGGLWRVVDGYFGRTASFEGVVLDGMKHRAAEQQVEMMNKLGLDDSEEDALES